MSSFRMALALLLAAALVSGPADAKVVGGEIVIGAALSLSGEHQSAGRHTRRGYDLAVERINEGGGVTVGGKAYRLRILYYDDGSSAERAAALARRLIEQDGVQYMLGPYTSGITEAVAQVTERLKVPMVEANGASRALFNKGRRHLFAVLSTADRYLSGAVDLVAGRSSALLKRPHDIRVALVFSDDLFSQDVRLGALARIEAHGMQVVIDDRLPSSTSDLQAALTRVMAARADMLLVSGHARAAADTAQLIEQLKVDVPVIAMTHCGVAGIEARSPRGAANVMCALQWQKDLDYRDDDGLFGSGGDFARIFERRYGYEPPYQAAESAAAVQVWADAFERARGLGPAQLRDAIAATDMQTFFGFVRFNEAGQNVAKPMATGQILGGRYKVVAPRRWAAAEPLIPRPSGI